MFTVFEEAVINLDGKLKQEMEQSTALQVCQRVFGRLNLVCVIAGHCGHQLNPDGYKSSVVCSLHCHSLIGTVRIMHLDQGNPCY